ncbi:SDR family oxidoreductase [Rhodococcus erythropolis]|uniref:SDR family oxidoreductase n=1 Tax=Rhodococcus qingshengii TaxID=334542 RepID=UPI003600296E|nr:SDR family oxidoreductase [Rhodococcus erythropolis]
MDLGVEGRVALVAASTGGLGLAVATSLAAEGARVVVTGRDLERARSVAATLPGATAFHLDLGVPGAPAETVDRVTAELGSVEILVTNGPGPKPKPASDTSAEDLSEAIDGLLLPQQRLIASVLPGMVKRGWGRILAIGSSGITAPLPNLVLSNVGRSALAAYIKTLASEQAHQGVTANLLLPGRINTDRVDALDAAAAARRDTDVQTVRAESFAAIPAGRYGRPEEFGAAAAFLCSDSASYITGVALRCDGGLVRSL